MAKVLQYPAPLRADEELELKYTIDDPAAAGAWFDRVYPADPRGWESVRIVDRYFDTADRALSEAGYGARLRRVGGQTILTVKADLEVTDARHLRLELEAPATKALDPNEWPQSAARDRVIEVAGGRRLIELFVVRQHRRERPITVGGAELLVSIDRGTVHVAGVEAGELLQLEVEFVSGRRAAINRVARAIEEAGIGRPESRSKLALALEMAEESERVRADDTLAEAGRKVMRRHLVRLLSREQGVRDGDELETKQMRVATRRLRATWLVFGEAFKAGVAKDHNRELRRLGRAIGEVRDQDVLIESVARKPALLPIAEEWRQRRSAAHDELLRMLDSKDYRRFVDEMLHFTASPGKGVRGKGGRRLVGEAVESALATAVERVRATEIPATDEGDGDVAVDVDAAWHARRIEARRLRYSIEAFVEVLDEVASKRLLESITRLQDRLGTLQDSTIAIDEMSGWLEGHGADIAPDVQRAADAYLERRLADVEKAKNGLDAAWSALLVQADVPVPLGVALTRR
jgi:CHAD domain-containing protein